MAVRIEHLYKKIGKQQVLQDVTFSIREGEIVGLLGPNGAGKSTLMKILVGVWDASETPGNAKTAGAAEAPDKAKAAGAGKAAEAGDATAEAGAEESEERERTVVEVPERIGYLPEQNPLYEEMYVAEYLQFMAGLTNPGMGRKARQECVEGLIERVGLTPERHKKIGQLSKGYKQRVGLAQALLGEPELLILDEPTTGLDPNQLVEIRALIRELGRDRTVILSTHILQEVREMCDRVLILDHGRLRADKRIEEIDDLERLFVESTKSE